jgi:cystathionine beta-lyase
VTHPFHEIAKSKQRHMDGFFDFVSGAKQDAVIFLEKIKSYLLAESLSGTHKSSCFTTHFYS